MRLPTREGMPRRAATALLAALACLPAAPAAGAAPPAPLTDTRLRDGLHDIATRLAVAPVVAPSAPVSVRAFDRLLVEQLGLTDVARTVQAETWRAGLNPPPWFGSEVVARELGLRRNIRQPHDDRELYPWEAITRAEAMHSFARARALGPWGIADARATLSRFRLPRYSAAQRAALRIAVSKIGMPYVWGGETDRVSSYFGGQEHGGYDCSGLVWRVFKLGGLPAGRRIRGRTAAMQAGEIRRSARIRLARVQAGDLVFFGPGRFWQRATERRITHVGIAMSPEFMIHASAQGVYVSSLLEDWRRERFSWARRVL